MKAAIYARYSSDKQNDTSLEDQFRVCRARAAREGADVEFERSDAAISGSTAVASRPGGNAMLADALAGRFEILLVEGLDRLSRDQVEQERVVRRLEHRGIRIIGAADGYDSNHSGRKIMRGVRGLINDLYLDDLRSKTHRGQSGQVERGYIAGGKSYGYDIERIEGGSQYRVNPQQARWVVWIFEQYAAGNSVQKIAHALNNQGVPSPRDGTWAVSAIYGSPMKGSGILNNSMYVGKYVWNRSQWIKDPDTGRRQRIERPREEWQEAALPELRIVDDQLWGQVRDRIDAGRDEHGRKRQVRPATTLFGGMMTCPHCGGAVVAINADRYGCAAAKDRGPAVCKGFSIPRDLVEKRLVSIVRGELLSPMAAAEFEKAFLELLQESTGTGEDAVQANKRIAQLTSEIGKIVDAIAMVGASDALAERLKSLENDRRAIQRRLALKAASEAANKPNIAAIFNQILMNLTEALRENPLVARKILGDIFGSIQLELREDNQVWAKMATAQLLKQVAGPSISVVAGAGDFSLFPEHSLETLIQAGLQRLFSTVAGQKRWFSRWNTTLMTG
ncbi:recombinase family protein [Herbaspirillum seropedicae]|uniref:recombinase family protein n=1 Tax=Herbaspirillum seropedicae TaxID=964 RepID=UPI00111E7DB7|nr:recombinase family protein [Herbaspirillum seropedicae]QDD65573.1 recombinase family protein [Herbaspirillum seropedicae]